MNHAEKVKRWVSALLDTGADVYASRERAKVSKKLHAAIDEMQAEIERLTAAIALVKESAGKPAIVYQLTKAAMKERGEGV